MGLRVLLSIENDESELRNYIMDVHIASTNSSHAIKLDKAFEINKESLLSGFIALKRNPKTTDFFDKLMLSKADAIISVFEMKNNRNNETTAVVEISRVENVQIEGDTREGICETNAVDVPFITGGNFM